MASKRVVTRDQAERLIAGHQVELMRQYDCLSTWELYADFGVGPCCGGIFRLSTIELKGVYRRHIPKVEGMNWEELIRSILRFERRQLGGRLINCQAAASQGRVCDGLDRYTNQELSWLFPEVLGDCQVVDSLMTLDEAATFLGIRRNRLLELIYSGEIPVEKVGLVKKVDLEGLASGKAPHSHSPQP